MSSARRSRIAAGTELERLIGFFVNTLVLRVGSVWETDLQRICSSASAKFASAPTPIKTCPFEKLVEELQPERDLEPQSLISGHVRLAKRAQALSAELPDSRIEPSK